MTASRIYLDHNASAPLRPTAREASIAALEATGNPSSTHGEGRAVRALVEASRRHVAALLGAEARAVIFTSGATEAANLVLRPGLTVPGRARPVRMLMGATEHPCVLAGHRFAQATIIPVDHHGTIRLDALAAAVKEDGPVLLALQAANNETGVVQPVRAAADIVHAAGGIVVSDVVQAAGRIACDIGALGADAVIVSSHKLGGPKGAGALVFAASEAHIEAPLIRGGGQERGLRSGTEDVAAIAGFGAACREVALTGTGEAAEARCLRDAFEAGLRRLDPSVLVLGVGAQRLPNTSCFCLPGLAVSTLLMALDLAGIAISAGSACSSGKLARSPVLDAMGCDAHIRGALRVSFGRNSRSEHVEATLQALETALHRLTPVRAA